jgi:UDP-N-acetylglucosamine 4-epimerase
MGYIHKKYILCIYIYNENKQPTINGDGTFSRDFTYVNNVVQANIKALTISNKECYGEVFNIGAGGRITILELVDAINKGLNANITPILGPNRAGDITHSNADISKGEKYVRL